MCYFGSWSTYRWGEGTYDVEDIDPFLCTHIMFGFAGLNSEDFTIKVLDPYNELYDNYGKGAYDRFTFLKNYNPNLKTFLSVGGWNEGATKYSEMVSSKEHRTTFINSTVELILKHNFDGLDFDWEYPSGREDSPGKPEDKENYITLLRELRERFEEHGLMLTAAVSASASVLDKAYDVPAMSELLDYINLMTYDYHGWFPKHTFTGHNSPLYGSPEEDNDEDSPGHHFNMNYSVNYWVGQGAKRSQLLLGLATYGRGFTLTNPEEHGLYAEARAGCQAGPYTGQAGYVGYNELCDRALLPGDWTTVRDEYVRAPYVYKGNQWIGYDDEQSISEKCDFIVTEELGGAMFWSLDTDDFRGKCGRPNALILTATEKLNGGKMTTPDGWTTPSPSVSPSTPDPDTPPPTEFCTGELGPQANPYDCHQFYICQMGSDGWLINLQSCGELAFNPDLLICDWLYNVPSCNTTQTGF